MASEPFSCCSANAFRRPEFCCSVCCPESNSPMLRSAGRLRRQIAFRDCADGEHIVYADIGDALLDSEGRLSVAVSPDWLHFSERGYALLESSLEQVLDRVLASADSCCQPR